MTTTTTDTTAATGVVAVDGVNVDTRWIECTALDTAEHLSASLGKALELPASLDCESWATEQEDALCRWFARLTHQRYEQVVRDNTYNSENDLSSQFVFSVFAPEGCGDWLYCDDVFLLLKHT